MSDIIYCSSHYWDAWNKYKEKEKEEMSIPNLSFEELETQALHYGEDISIYINEVFRELDEKEAEEEKNMVIDPFVQDMCNYYKLEDVISFQYYYDYLVAEIKDMTKIKKLFNEEMKKHVEEMKLEDPRTAAKEVIDQLRKAHETERANRPLWEALEKHK